MVAFQWVVALHTLGFVHSRIVLSRIAFPWIVVLGLFLLRLKLQGFGDLVLVILHRKGNFIIGRYWLGHTRVGSNTAITWVKPYRAWDKYEVDHLQSRC